MQQCDEAFILRTQPLGDADLIVSFLARSHGCIRGVASSGRRSRKRFGGLLEPMTHVEATWTVKTGRDLHRIDRLEARRSYASMQSDPALQSVCAVMAEVGEAFGVEGAADEREFRLFGAVLSALDAGGEPLLLLRYFEFWTLRLHGLLGDSESEAEEARLNRNEAGWIERLENTAPERLPASRGVARSGGRLERMFRSRLEAYTERRFKTYRHVHALAADDGGGS